MKFIRTSDDEFNKYKRKNLNNKEEQPREELISLLLEIIEEEGEINNETN